MWRKLAKVVVVFTVIGVLLLVFLPAYDQHGCQAGCLASEAADLRLIAQLEERYFTENNEYATSLQQLGWPDAVALSRSGQFESRILEAKANSYVLVAVAVNPSVSGCDTFKLDSKGNRTGNCWVKVEESNPDRF